MPNVKGAAVAVVGNILSIDQTFKFDEATRTATNESDGAKVLVGTADGMALIKVDRKQLEELRPVLMQPFAGFVRYGAWAGRGGQGDETCRYIGPVGADFLDRLASAIGSKQQQQPAAKPA